MIYICLTPDLSKAQEANNKFVRTGEYVTLCGIKGGKISKPDLLSANSLIIEQDSSSDFQIIAFKLTVVYPSELLEFENAGDGKITEEMKTALKKTYEGCKVFIEYIKSLSSDGTLHSHPPISYRVVE